MRIIYTFEKELLIIKNHNVMKKFMLFGLAALLGIAAANAQDPCNVPVNLEVTNITANSARVTWSGGDAPVTDGFPGDWELSFSENDQMNMTLTLDPMLHMYLQMQGSDIEDMDTMISVAGIPVFVTIEQADGDQYNVSGSFDMEFGMTEEPIQFHFNTTGTLGVDGLSIEPAAISETINLMGQLPLNFTGTATFAQPTALPTNGVLTVEIASLDIDGVGEIAGLGNAILITLDGSQLHATGSLAIPGVEGYEILLTNVLWGTTNTVSTSYSHHSFYDLDSETDYTVAVRTLCTGNTYSEWSEAVPFTTLEGSDYSDYCDMPTNVTVEQTTEGDTFNARISWEGTADEYDIEIKTASEMQPFMETINAIVYDFTGDPSTTYTVRVRARCQGMMTSVWTEAVSFTTPAAPQPQGIDDVVASNSVTIFPNPATSRATVTVEGLSGNAQLNVIDMSGRIVMVTTMNNGSAQLNVSNLAKGTYFVRISGEQISTVRKLIVK